MWMIAGGTSPALMPRYASQDTSRRSAAGSASIALPLRLQRSLRPVDLGELLPQEGGDPALLVERRERDELLTQAGGDPALLVERREPNCGRQDLADWDPRQLAGCLVNRSGREVGRAPEVCRDVRGVGDGPRQR